ncbi:hypothetical protein [Candidatus Thiosymbion oneisti]|uniref:hypothetical protein n=1 Tax=Candidatus Thiosymbion oneisti TaxID=589554 RepID=UPI000B7F0EFB|nr:hypothetical protein [Candidatus Thiosymbion oneisti]
MSRFALLLPALLAWPLLASPAFGSKCFCLVAADDTTWFDCLKQQTDPPSTQPRIFCLDAVSGEQIELTGRADLEPVADGEPRCKPCRLSDRADLGRVMRGENGEDNAQAAPPTATTRPADGEEDQP